MASEYAGSLRSGIAPPGALAGRGAGGTDGLGTASDRRRARGAERAPGGPRGRLDWPDGRRPADRPRDRLAAGDGRPVAEGRGHPAGSRVAADARGAEPSDRDRRRRPRAAGAPAGGRHGGAGRPARADAAAGRGPGSDGHERWPRHGPAPPRSGDGHRRAEPEPGPADGRRGRGLCRGAGRRRGAPARVDQRRRSSGSRGVSIGRPPTSAPRPRSAPTTSRSTTGCAALRYLVPVLPVAADALKGRLSADIELGSRGADLAAPCRGISGHGGVVLKRVSLDGTPMIAESRAADRRGVATGRVDPHEFRHRGRAGLHRPAHARHRQDANHDVGLDRPRRPGRLPDADQRPRRSPTRPGPPPPRRAEGGRPGR